MKSAFVCYNRNVTGINKKKVPPSENIDPRSDQIFLAWCNLSQSFQERRGGEGSFVQVTSFAPKHDCIGTKQGGHDSMDKSWQTWGPFSHSLWFPVKCLLEELTRVTSVPLLFPLPPHMGSWNVCASHNIHLDDLFDWSPDKWGWLALFTRFSLNLDFRPLSRELWRRAELKTGRCYFDIHNPHREMTSSNNTWLTMTKNSIFVLLKPF